MIFPVRALDDAARTLEDGGIEVGGVYVSGDDEEGSLFSLETSFAELLCLFSCRCICSLGKLESLARVLGKLSTLRENDFLANLLISSFC